METVTLSQATQSLAADLGQTARFDGNAFVVGDVALPWRWPSGTMTEHVEFQHSAAALRTAAQASARGTKIRNDARLSDLAKTEQLALVAGEEGAVLGRTEREFEAHVERTAAAEAAAFTPPRPVDAEEIANDREIRDGMRALPIDEQLAMAKRVHAGEEPRILLALARSPFPPHPAARAVVAEAWRAEAIRRNPACAGFAALHERQAIARQAVAQARSVLSKMKAPANRMDDARDAEIAARSRAA